MFIAFAMTDATLGAVRVLVGIWIAGARREGLQKERTENMAKSLWLMQKSGNIFKLSDLSAAHKLCAAAGKGNPSLYPPCILPVFYSGSDASNGRRFVAPISAAAHSGDNEINCAPRRPCRP
jgi:hypothetical protein